MAAATRNRMIPSAISPRPGQFDFSPKPRAGLRGSRVAPGPSEGIGLRLSRPCQMGGAAVSTTPARIQNPAIQISTMRSQFVAQYPYHASRTAVLRPVHGPAPAAAQDGRSRFPAVPPAQRPSANESVRASEAASEAGALSTRAPRRPNRRGGIGGPGRRLRAAYARVTKCATDQPAACFTRKLLPYDTVLSYSGHP